ncbi:MAG: glycosyltransferase [Actinobacteria bacterium]|nr:glycosyltransferase [Actinomycetota bacterium]
MRVAVVTTGSRGDVQPFVALVAELQRHVDSAVLAAPAAFAPLAAAHDVAFHGLPVDPAGVLATEVGQRWIDSGRDLRAFLRGLRALADPLGEQLADAMIAVCADVDVIVYATLAFPAWHIADARGVPAVQVAFAPSCPTAVFPPPMVPDLFADHDARRSTVIAALARFYHRSAHWVFNQLLWLPLRRRINRWRRSRLGAAPLGWRSPGLDVDRRGEPLLHAFSPTILAPPADWGPHVVTTGAWFLDDTIDWAPSAVLEDFLSAGPPPVVIGMGSMAAREPVALTRTVVDALRRADRRGLLLAGWAGLGEAGPVARNTEVLVCDDVPHGWLLPRAAAAVHHGGSGTTAASLRAGIPTVVVPHFGDQPFWGDRVTVLGAGPPPIPRRELTADRLARAITRAVDDRAIHKRAAVIGERIRAERGVERAVAEVLRVARAR